MRSLARRYVLRASIAAATLAAAAIVLSPQPSPAQESATAFVSRLGAQGLPLLAPGVGRAERAARFRQLYREYFDTAGITSFVLGRYRSLATPQQLQEFAQLYEEFTAGAYAARLGGASGVPFRVTGSRPYGDQIVVTSEIARSDGSRMAIDWYLIARGGRYLITDVVAGGVSMKMSERDHFAEWIQGNGGRFDALLAVMRQQIQAWG